MNRPTPFEIVFGALADERFPALKASLGAAGIDPYDRDAFVLDRAVTEFLRDLVPEDAPTESLREFIAVLQHNYLFWDAGRTVQESDRRIGGSTDDLIQAISVRPSAHPPIRPAYLQLPSHLYWGQLEPDEPHEPLDGFFVHRWKDGIRALAIFGLHPERPGVSVSEVVGAPPAPLIPREDGSLPYAPLMEGGVAAGLRSVADNEELLALAWSSLTPEA